MGRIAKPWLRSGRGWYVEIGGRQVKLCGAKASATKANEEWRKLEDAKGTVAYRDLTVRQLAELFCQSIAGQLAATTVNWYAGHLTAFSKEYRTLKLPYVTAHHLTKHLNAKADWSPSTRRGRITAVKQCFAWAKGEGFIAVSPFLAVKRPKMGVRKPIPLADALKLIASIENKATLELITLLAETGARPGELSRATAAGLDREAKTLETVGKMGARKIVLSDVALALVCQLAERRPEGALLRSPRGNPWNRDSMRNVFKRLRDKTGIKNATAYAIRHLWATVAIKNNVNPLLVASLMGHTDLKMLHEVYTHHEADTLRDAAQQASGGIMG